MITSMTRLLSESITRCLLTSIIPRTPACSHAEATNRQWSMCRQGSRWVSWRSCARGLRPATRRWMNTSGVLFRNTSSGCAWRRSPPAMLCRSRPDWPISFPLMSGEESRSRPAWAAVSDRSRAGYTRPSAGTMQGCALTARQPLRLAPGRPGSATRPLPLLPGLRFPAMAMAR